MRVVLFVSCRWGACGHPSIKSNLSHPWGSGVTACSAELKKKFLRMILSCFSLMNHHFISSAIMLPTRHLKSRMTSISIISYILRYVLGTWSRIVFDSAVLGRWRNLIDDPFGVRRPYGCGALDRSRGARRLILFITHFTLPQLSGGSYWVFGRVGCLRP